MRNKISTLLLALMCSATLGCSSLDQEESSNEVIVEILINRNDYIVGGNILNKSEIENFLDSVPEKTKVQVVDLNSGMFESRIALKEILEQKEFDYTM